MPNRLITLIDLVCFGSYIVDSSSRSIYEMPTLDYALLTKAVVMAYFTSWNYFPTEHIPSKCLTHVTYAFANIQDGVVVPGDRQVDLMQRIPNPNWKKGSSIPKHFRGAMQALTHPDGPTSLCNPDLKKLIAVGGWTFSKEFSNVASTPESRKKFAKSLVSYIVRYGFDGADLDWEHPVEGGMPTNSVSPQDKENFTLLLKEIRHYMDQFERRSGSSPMLLTAATAASKRLTDHLDLEGMSQFLDWFNIMIYDFAGPWENATAHNAPFQPAFDQSVHNYLVRNITPDKIVAGLPLYGKQFAGAFGKAIGSPYQLAKTPIGNDVIEENLTSSKGYEVQWDDTAKAGYLWNEKEKEFVTYEHPNSSFIKAQFVNAQKLAGMFMWELSHDRKFKVLRKILPQLRISLGLEPYYHQCTC